MKRTAVVATMVVVALVGVVAYAYAATLTADLTINARVANKFALALSQNTIDWTNGGLGYQPDDPAMNQPITATIDSNRQGDLTAVWTTAPAAGFDITSVLQQDVDGVPFVKGAGQTFGDVITFAPDWDTPTDVTDTSVLQYTAIQGP